MDISNTTFMFMYFLVSENVWKRHENDPDLLFNYHVLK